VSPPSEANATLTVVVAAEPAPSQSEPKSVTASTAPVAAVADAEPVDEVAADESESRVELPAAATDPATR
jgi:hypothetical protein